MNRIVFVVLVLPLFVLSACGASVAAEQDGQPAAEAQTVVSEAATSPQITVYKTPT